MIDSLNFFSRTQLIGENLDYACCKKVIHHAKAGFPSAPEVDFEKSMTAKIHKHPRRSAQGIYFFLICC
jgi:hypothetical protein